MQFQITWWGCGPARVQRGIHSPPHERLVDRLAQVEDVVADGEVVLEAEGRQHDPVAHREREAQLVHLALHEKTRLRRHRVPDSVSPTRFFAL